MTAPVGADWELLVVNNNCTDATDAVVASFVDRLPVRRLFEATPGLSTARNLAVREAKCVFTIANTGVEIPPEERDRIFDRFHRVESSRTRNRAQGGQGLGLSICREIALAHGGTLTLEPAEPGKTKFQLTLPLHPLQPATRVAATVKAD